MQQRKKSFLQWISETSTYDLIINTSLKGSGLKNKKKCNL